MIYQLILQGMVKMENQVDSVLCGSNSFTVVNDFCRWPRCTCILYWLVSMEMNF